MLPMKVQGQMLAVSARPSSAVPMLPLRASFGAAPRVARFGARMPSVRAAAASKDGIEKVANDIGLPTDEGLFGFSPFAEQWTGRLAMMGFLTSIVEEAITGRGTLGQIGLDTPNQTLLILIINLSVGASLVGIGATLNNARVGKMSLNQLARYRSFLGMKGEAADIAATQRAMKLDGDFTTPGDNKAAIEAAKAAGTPADAILSPTNDAAVASAAADMKKDGGVFALETEREAALAAASMKEREAGRVGATVSMSGRDDIQETGFFTSADMSYAKGVELSNGRWAMIGFLAAILVEAGTGNGIIGQLIAFAKFTGLLGPMSGF